MSGRVVACVFCDLMATGDANWVTRGRDAVAFLPLPDSALAPGHTLVVPRRHCSSVLDATADVLLATTLLTQRVAGAMQRGLAATGVVVLNASGPHSGQSVDHLHFHVVPCWPDDDADFWPRDRSAHPPIGDVHQVLARALA
ncbi:MAG: histidine triad family protein [Nocardioidaceae bacterium]|nr:histidine triad family protein [Nocardioidaceae bacterium]